MFLLVFGKGGDRFSLEESSFGGFVTWRRIGIRFSPLRRGKERAPLWGLGGWHASQGLDAGKQQQSVQSRALVTLLPQQEPSQNDSGVLSESGFHHKTSCERNGNSRRFLPAIEHLSKPASHSSSQ